MGDFRGLSVWQRAKDLSVMIYRVTSEGRFARDFGLRDQLRRAAVSIPSNIAEGDELDTNNQSIRHFYISKGSVAEVLTQSIIAREIGYIEKIQFDQIEAECRIIASMLTRLIQARKAMNPKNKHPKTPDVVSPKP